VTRAVVLQAGDEAAIATALGYPTPCYSAATGEVVPGVYSLRHRDVETDYRGRTVLVVDDVEAALPAPIRARVVDVTRAAVEVIE
jgi:hypothetical protein